MTLVPVLSSLGECRIDGALERLRGGVATVRQVLVLGLAPQQLDGIQLRAVRREIEEAHPQRLQSRRLLLDQLAAVDGVVVQHHHTWPSPAVANRRVGWDTGDHFAHEAQVGGRVIFPLVGAPSLEYQAWPTAV